MRSKKRPNRLNEKDKKDVANLYWVDNLTFPEIQNLHRYRMYNDNQLRTAAYKYKPYKFNDRPFLDIEAKDGNSSYWMTISEAEHLAFRRNIPIPQETQDIFRIGRYFRTLEDESARI